MIPRIGKQGSSFKGAGLYYLHDKEAITSDRVAFSHTENLPTDDPQMALHFMAYTAMDAESLKRQSGVRRTGGPAKKPVFTLSLAWHPEQEPEQEHMIDAANSALAALGLQDHQAVMVGHNDEAHQHIHVILNLIDPETGRTASLPFTKEKLSKWAQEYELEHGKIYCEQRVENNAKREQAKEQDTEEFPRYKDPELEQKQLITQLYQNSDSGKGFQAAMAEHGYTLAQGKRIVIIDQNGAQHSISRQIDGVKAKDIRAKLSDIVLPSVDEVRPPQLQDNREQKQTESEDQENRTNAASSQPSHAHRPPAVSDKHAKEPVYFDRDEQDRQWFESIIDAALAGTDRPPKEKDAEDESRRLNQIQDRQLQELGRFYDENTDARLRLSAEMESVYGNDHRRLRAEIKEREISLQNAGRLRRFLMHLTGRYTSIQQEIEEKSLSLRNIEWRKQERVDALEKQLAENRQRISARHEQERGPVATPKNENARVHEPAPPALQRNSNEVPANPQDIGYETRRAAFMERAQPPQQRISSNETEPLRPGSPQSLGVIALAPEFQEAANYETRRAAITKKPHESHSPTPDLAEDDGPSQTTG